MKRYTTLAKILIEYGMTSLMITPFKLERKLLDLWGVCQCLITMVSTIYQVKKAYLIIRCCHRDVQYFKIWVSWWLMENMFVEIFYILLTDHIRQSMGLKVTKHLVSSGEYKNLVHSLMCGLPNEVDFALNICTLLSNEGQHTIELQKCPHILKLLLAHMGIYGHGMYWGKLVRKLIFWWSNLMLSHLTCA